MLVMRTKVWAGITIASLMSMLVGAFGGAAADVGARVSKAKLTVDSSGFSTRPPPYEDEPYRTSFAAVLTNPTDQVVVGINVVIKGTGSDGKPVKDSIGGNLGTEGYVSVLYPGESTVVVADDLESVEPVAKMSVNATGTMGGSPEVYNVTPDPSTAGKSPSEMFVLSEPRYRTADTARGVVYGRLENTTGVTFSRVDVSCALLRGGVIIGGATGPVIALPVSATVGFDAGGPPDASVEEIRCSADPSTVVGDVNQLDVGTTGLGTGDGGRPLVSAATTLKNPSTKIAATIEVTFQFLDAAGEFVGSSLSQHSYLPPGASVYATAAQVPAAYFEAPPTSVNIRTNVDSFMRPKAFKKTFGGRANPGLEAAGAQYVDDQVVGEFRNSTSKSVSDVVVTCAVFDAEAIVAGAEDVVYDPVAPGDTMAFEALTIDGLNPSDVRCTAYSGH